MTSVVRAGGDGCNIEKGIEPHGRANSLFASFTSMETGCFRLRFVIDQNGADSRFLEHTLLANSHTGRIMPALCDTETLQVTVV